MGAEYPDGFGAFPQSIQTNIGIVPRLGHDPFQILSFTIHRSSYHKNSTRYCKHYKINHIQNANKTEKIQEENKLTFFIVRMMLVLKRTHNKT